MKKDAAAGLCAAAYTPHEPERACNTRQCPRVDDSSVGRKRMTIQLALAALGGLFIGSAIAFAVNAQKAPPAYFIAESVVTNPQADSAVIAKLPATAQPYGGKYLARGGKIVSLRGEPPQRPRIVAFDSKGHAQARRAGPQG